MNEEFPEVEIGDRVRLVAPVGDIPAGSEGVVFGFYRHPDEPALAVTFAGEARSVPVELVEVVEHAARGHRRRAG
jgi:hypothetical protein